MNIYLSSSVFVSLLQSPEKKNVQSIISQSISDKSKIFTSVVCIETIFNFLPKLNIETERKLIRLVDQIVDEVFGFDFSVYELILLNKEKNSIIEKNEIIEYTIAQQNAMDEYWVFHKQFPEKLGILPIRNLFGKTE
ncbi:hypothetical protein P3G55_19095 [Leptospira sp. 96542]|nr:hypothetical protein [Leptospira sp. 96542]